MEINILVEDGIETEAGAEWIQRLVEKILVGEGVLSNSELSVVITDQNKIRDLNRQFRGKDQPTDVLSFSMGEQQAGEDKTAFIGPPDGLIHLGEVIISYPQAVIQSQEREHSIRKELAILIVHGVLHILGYDHERPDLELAMVAREKEILESLEKEIE
jgi:probable rRNA maturation factor